MEHTQLKLSLFHPEIYIHIFTYRTFEILSETESNAE